MIDHKTSALLKPLGWAAEKLVMMARIEPRLIAHLLEADSTRLHVLALALCVLDGREADQAWSTAFATDGSRQIIGSLLGKCPAGLIGALRRLGPAVAPESAYQSLVAIVEDPSLLRLIQHRQAISAVDLYALARLPMTMRTATILRAFRGDITWVETFRSALAWLARRTPIGETIAAARSQGAAAAQLRDAIGMLPDPPFLPPLVVGNAHRVDDPRALRQMGKRFSNCLADYAGGVRDAVSAIYVWRAEGPTAVCSLVRRGRLGWFVDEIDGPKNRDPDAATYEAVQNAFEDAGMPSILLADALYSFLGWHPPLAGGWRRDDQGMTACPF